MLQQKAIEGLVAVEGIDDIIPEPPGIGDMAVVSFLCLPVSNPRLSPDPRHERIRCALADGEPRTTTQIASAVGVDRSAVRDLLLQLARMGHVRQVGIRLEEPAPGSGWQSGKHIRCEYITCHLI